MTTTHLKVMGMFMGLFAASAFVIGFGLNAYAKYVSSDSVVAATSDRCMTDAGEMVTMIKADITMGEYCALKREVVAENGGW